MKQNFGSFIDWSDIFINCNLLTFCSTAETSTYIKNRDRISYLLNFIKKGNILSNSILILNKI